MTFLGAIVRYRVTLQGDAELDILVPSPQAVYAPGEQVGLVLYPEDLVLFAPAPLA